jgi:hypothetical protein
MRKTMVMVLAGALGGLAVTALAEPLVKMEGGAAKPNIVTAWSSSGPKVELTIKGGVDPQAVASAIEGGVEKVKAKVQAGKVVVLGKAEADLLPALAQVDFGGGDDLGALAKNAASGGESDSGSSLRAKKTVDLDKMFKDQAVSAQGTVADVSEGKFPNAEVTINILRAPSGDLGKDVRKGKQIKFKPVFKMKGKDIDWSDENTQINAGAWYLQKGDKVWVKIGKGKDGVYEAVILTRG